MRGQWLRVWKGAAALPARFPVQQRLDSAHRGLAAKHTQHAVTPTAGSHNPLPPSSMAGNPSKKTGKLTHRPRIHSEGSRTDVGRLCALTVNQEQAAGKGTHSQPLPGD
jgi:hypothetical protein